MRIIWLIAVFVIALMLVSINTTLGQGSALFKVTSGTYSETADLNQAVKNEFGNEYKMADWNDINVYSGDALSWANQIGMMPRESYFVSWNGQGFYDGKRHYFITRHDHEVESSYLVHDQLDNHLIDLGSWYGVQMHVLAFKNPAKPSQQISVWTDRATYNQGESPIILYFLDKNYWGADFSVMYPDGTGMKSIIHKDATQGIHQWQPMVDYKELDPGTLTKQIGQYQVILYIKENTGLDTPKQVATAYYTVISPQPPAISSQTYCCGSTCPPGSICNQPQDAMAWNNKGKTLLIEGKFDEAIQAFDKAIEINPQFKEAWDGKGAALKVLGRITEANAAFAKVNELGGIKF